MCGTQVKSVPSSVNCGGGEPAGCDHKNIAMKGEVTARTELQYARRRGDTEGSGVRMTRNDEDDECCTERGSSSIAT